RWITPSRPASASDGAGSSSGRQATASTPSAERARSGLRESTVTSSPRALSAAAIRPPTRPVAPVIVTRIRQPPRSWSHLGYDAHSALDRAELGGVAARVAELALVRLGGAAATRL